MDEVKNRLQKVDHLISNDLRDILKKNSATITAINKLNETELLHDNKMRACAKKLYETAIIEAKKEEQVIRKALQQLYKVNAIINERGSHENKGIITRTNLARTLETSARNLPLWIGKFGDKSDKPPPLCGAIPANKNYVAKVGDMVAALQHSSGNWILTKVIHYNVSVKKYEVHDIDFEKLERMTLSRKDVIPLPLMRANPKTDPDIMFKKYSIAVVVGVPVAHNHEYELKFEDQDSDSGYTPATKVAQRYVISYRDNGDKK